MIQQRIRVCEPRFRKGGPKHTANCLLGTGISEGIDVSVEVAQQAAPLPGCISELVPVPARAALKD